ncbi:uncharacterized protein VP01_3606g1 [Puccinia sorghi]|uniref:Uncharacterized protein n=1 Tax=Puccinia sorghi TaxID=27349 RepID=A0A0L6UV13_9BASI|nr:uncharacterized protein VP01_3606g1 [Puccinia sorghi]
MDPASARLPTDLSPTSQTFYLTILHALAPLIVFREELVKTDPPDVGLAIPPIDKWLSKCARLSVHNGKSLFGRYLMICLDLRLLPLRPMSLALSLRTLQKKLILELLPHPKLSWRRTFQAKIFHPLHSAGSILPRIRHDFKRNIDAAAQAASNLQNLKLPKSLKEIVDTLATTILKTKQTAWEETGEIPEEEDIKIHTSPQTSHSSTTPQRIMKPCKKHTKVRHIPRPADLLEEDEDNLSEDHQPVKDSNSPNPSNQKDAEPAPAPETTNNPQRDQELQSNLPVIHLLQDHQLACPNDQWYFPDVIDFPLLAHFEEKAKQESTNDYISMQKITALPMSNLARLLYCLSTPSPSSISQWAKIVAACLKPMADNFYNPPPPEIINGADATIQGQCYCRFHHGLCDPKNSCSECTSYGND